MVRRKPGWSDQAGSANRLSPLDGAISERPTTIFPSSSVVLAARPAVSPGCRPRLPSQRPAEPRTPAGSIPAKGLAPRMAPVASSAISFWGPESGPWPVPAPAADAASSLARPAGVDRALFAGGRAAVGVLDLACREAVRPPFREGVRACFPPSPRAPALRALRAPL